MFDYVIKITILFSNFKIILNMLKRVLSNPRLDLPLKRIATGSSREDAISLVDEEDGVDPLWAVIMAKALNQPLKGDWRDDYVASTEVWDAMEETMQTIVVMARRQENERVVQVAMDGFLDVLQHLPPRPSESADQDEPKQVVCMLMKSCKVYIERYKEEKLRDLQENLKNSTIAVTQEMKRVENQLKQMRQSCRKWQDQLKLYLLPVETEMEAYFELFNSKDPEILNLILKWRKAKDLTRQKTDALAVEAESLSYFLACDRLARQVFNMRRPEEMAKRLKSYVEKLSRAILKFVQVETHRKVVIDEKIETLTRELDEHLELFSGQADTNETALKKSLAEWKAIRCTTLNQMTDLATSQVAAWERLVPQLSIECQSIVIAELRQLYHQLDAPWREIYSPFLQQHHEESKVTENTSTGCSVM